jgi:hypothetical protein
MSEVLAQYQTKFERDMAEIIKSFESIMLESRSKVAHVKVLIEANVVNGGIGNVVINTHQIFKVKE